MFALFIIVGNSRDNSRLLHHFCAVLTVTSKPVNNIRPHSHRDADSDRWQKKHTFPHSLVQRQDILVYSGKPTRLLGQRWFNYVCSETAWISVEIVSSYTWILRGNSCEFQHNMSSPCLRTAQSLFMNIDYNVFLPETSSWPPESEMSHTDNQYVDVQ